MTKKSSLPAHIRNSTVYGSDAAGALWAWWSANKFRRSGRRRGGGRPYARGVVETQEPVARLVDALVRLVASHHRAAGRTRARDGQVGGQTATAARARGRDRPGRAGCQDPGIPVHVHPVADDVERDEPLERQGVLRVQVGQDEQQTCCRHPIRSMSRTRSSRQSEHGAATAAHADNSPVGDHVQHSAKDRGCDQVSSPRRRRMRAMARVRMRTKTRTSGTSVPSFST